jgi:hypothetical protein
LQQLAQNRKTTDRDFLADAIIGVAAIAEFWGSQIGEPTFSRQRALYAIYRRYIPARKIGTQWIASKRELERAAQREKDRPGRSLGETD